MHYIAPHSATEGHTGKISVPLRRAESLTGMREMTRLAAFAICGIFALGCNAGGRGNGGGGGGGGGGGETGDMGGPSKKPFQMGTVIVPGAPADSPNKFGG